MAVSGDVTLAQDGARLHPYIVALVRWCVSSFWSTASVLIHRLLTAPLPPITAAKPAKTRPASSDHLHPVPLVDCVVLHNPPSHTIDVIFVHGLYGSLGNTWRQGEWKANYKMNPDIVPLRRHSNSIPEMTEQNIQITQSDDEDCKDNSFNKKMDDFREKMNDLKYNRDRINNQFINFNEFNDQNDYENRTDFNDTVFRINDNNEDRSQLNDDLKNIFKDNVDNVSEFYEDMKKILPNENMFITEKFYNNTLLDQVEIVGNYESQANFVRDLFKSSCESKSDNCECHGECEVGCGCVCDMCYSPCWPRDWIKVDFPGARVISINYTSDPYLWRPLWIKEIKRLRLHERAEQMTSQLLDLGVGQKPIIWVGHSKGGLFIKQIYCDAYDAHLQVTKESVGQNEINDGTNEFNDRFNDISDDALCNTNGIEDKTIQNSGNPSKRAGLWRNSAGFMFYSVPHRGSPLADIKTPITARSIELLEICKNCPLLLSLQERWLAATSPFSPAVHSVVETCRTLMSVLWLRIVSIDSADPGRGSLHGVSVDHREICKPTSRHCTLYTELISLMRTALNKS